MVEKYRKLAAIDGRYLYHSLDEQMPSPQLPITTSFSFSLPLAIYVYTCYTTYITGVDTLD